MHRSRRPGSRGLLTSAFLSVLGQGRILGRLCADGRCRPTIRSGAYLIDDDAGAEQHGAPAVRAPRHLDTGEVRGDRRSRRPPACGNVPRGLPATVLPQAVTTSTSRQPSAHCPSAHWRICQTSRAPTLPSRRSISCTILRAIRRTCCWRRTPTSGARIPTSQGIASCSWTVTSRSLRATRSRIMSGSPTCRSS